MRSWWLTPRRRLYCPRSGARLAPRHGFELEMRPHDIALSEGERLGVGSSAGELRDSVPSLLGRADEFSAIDASARLPASPP